MGTSGEAHARGPGWVTAERGADGRGKEATLLQAPRLSQILALLFRAPQVGEEEPAPWVLLLQPLLPDGWLSSYSLAVE